MSPIQIPIDAITSRFGDRFNSLRSQSLGTRFANLRPISEFLDFKRISKPANFGEAQSRVNYNLSYFSSNYAAIFVMLSIYSLLTNPMLLFVIFLVSGGLWGIGKLGGRDLDLGFARFNTSQLYTGLLLVAVPLGFWASPFSTVLWLIGATADQRDGRNGWRSSVMEHDGHDNAPGPVDGADYDMYEDTNSTVAYAVRLAMKDNEDWLVERALERIRRAHSEGHKNITFSKRELEALERRRLQEAPDLAVDNQFMKGVGSGTSAAPASPNPLDTSLYGTWARTTSASVRPQSSTTTLRSPLQPPFPGSMSRQPPSHAPPTISRSHTDEYQRIPSYQALELRQPGHSLHSHIDPQRGSPTRSGQRPYLNFPSHTSFVPTDLASLAPDPVVNKDNEGDKSSPQKCSEASSGDEIPMVEVFEHKVPSYPTRPAGSRQRISRP
ncbi:PRA1 family protein-domain-containing protein [Aspergillus aurantiobrunneus]